ncbi:hypothetical protein D477_015179 [Arthrobacter crystallopoietes BAB-32]|uniref:Antitoxin n=1 Tax=Arthrobacter crystallopoietes BAB-32 TaxID=1246476 RepID=N1USK4_9MICC|nr:type II toxin-antitoxin system Phd/YefM family antitoxin [Arthrobacter crystallopoietes]EMY33381.1 hypothetical protein D477_015179 [Arthrobacter crystallopoietes BAB-32]
MTTVSVVFAQNRLREPIDRSHREAVFLEQRGRVQAVLISPEQYERMMEALEEAEDGAAFDTAMAEEGPNIPWARVIGDLGWE